MPGVRTSDNSIPQCDFGQLGDGTGFLLDLADIRLGTPGANGKCTPYTMRAFSQSYLLSATAHGLAAHVGKPLSGKVILDDTNAAHFPTGILVFVPDANTLCVVTNGLVSFDSSLMEAGYDLETDGPYVYWDYSAGKYVSLRPADSVQSIREILRVHSVSGGTVRAFTIDWGPPSAAEQLLQPCASATAADGDATPDVTGLSAVQLANTGATSITAIDGGLNGQRVTFYASNANSTFVDGVALQCAGGANLSLGSGESVDFVKFPTAWVQACAAVAH